jgi:iron complex transport system substrate-binding protein
VTRSSSLVLAAARCCSLVAWVLCFGLTTSLHADGLRDRSPYWLGERATRALGSSSMKPSRIVSLAPVVTETLFALGAGARVVGVTRYCDQPAEATSLPRVGGLGDASLEAILGLSPDVVVAMPSSSQRTLFERLLQRGVDIFVVYGDQPEELRAMFLALGELVGSPDRAAALVARQDEALAQISQRRQGLGQTVAVVVGTDPLVVAGPQTFAAAAVRATGARSAVVSGDPLWPQWSLESVLTRRVDVLVAAEGQTTARRLHELLGALGPKAPRVVFAPRAILMRPGPSFVDDALLLEGLLAKPVMSSP